MAVTTVFAAGISSCSDNDDPKVENATLTVSNIYPEGFVEGEKTVESVSMVFTELNTREVTTYTSAEAAASSWTVSLPAGLYDYTGVIDYKITLSDGNEKPMRLRCVGNSVTVTGSSTISPEWFNISGGNQNDPEDDKSGLVISEIYAAGSLNAAGTGGVRDAFIRIYNNSDKVQYADGLGIVESDFVNAKTNDYEILTPANDRAKNFTVGTVWVIPGSGKDVPVNPGEYITVADQAIDWSAQVANALDLTGADFEWYDDHAMDTDNPAVPNLDKWFCYSRTIWIMSNQCNRSYAIVRFPEGMTSEKYLAEYKGEYDYINSLGSQMHKAAAYLIPNEWIIDGVNLSDNESFVRGALSVAVDASFAAISDKARDPNRFGHKFIRKTAVTTADSRVILQDTDNSADDFTLVNAR